MVVDPNGMDVTIGPGGGFRPLGPYKVHKQCRFWTPFGSCTAGCVINTPRGQGTYTGSDRILLLFVCILHWDTKWEALCTTFGGFAYSTGWLEAACINYSNCFLKYG
jgi:hypothetical protein